MNVTTEQSNASAMEVVEHFCAVYGWNGISGLLGACIEWSLVNGYTEGIAHAIEILPNVHDQLAEIWSQAETVQ